jgi:hypothetical protein
MSKFLRYRIAVQSKVYQELVEETERQLVEIGHFAKINVANRAGYAAVFDDIRWDYIRRMIEEKHNTELIPLGPAFFKRHIKKEEVSFTEKFVARGNGRGTVGYAIASEQNGHFVIHRLNLKIKMSKAFADSAEDTRALAVRVGAIKPIEPAQASFVLENKTDDKAPKFLR